MKAFLLSLLSRKLLATLGAAATALAAGDVKLAVAAVIGYVLAQGATDAAGAFKAGPK